MFWDEKALFQEDALKLGNYLGPNIDVTSALMAKIYTQNGHLLHR